ncbi:MAG: LPS-assembly protein LptD [Acidiferrobacterales bacterium]
MLLGLASVARAEEPSSCIVPPAPVKLDKAINDIKPDPDLKNNEIRISAESAKLIGSNTTVFEGNVILVHRGRKILADKATYDRAAARLDLQGHVRIESAEGDVFQTSSARLNANSEVGTLENGDFYILTNQSRGNAKKMVLNQDKSITFESVHFSTCPADQESWSIYFRRLTIDRESDDAIGRNAVFRVQNIPVFYTPYLRLPLGNRRKSGILAPDFGTNEKTGASFSLPYYFNLAPNYDATVTPRWLEKRGILAGTEFRYLGNTYSGQANFDYLPADRLAGMDRSYANLQHEYHPRANLKATIDYQQVSDSNYFIDLEGNTLESNPTHLPQRLQVEYHPTGWAIDGQIVNYQVLDTTLIPSEQPYQRLPQIGVQMDPRYTGGLTTSLSAQYGRFEHSNASVESATRVNLNPGIRYSIYRPWGYLVPGINGYYTAYTDRSIGSDTAVSTAILSIDAGLNFSNKTLGDTGWQQTLEPRLYYVYSPYVDQSALPVFDTARAEFSFDSLFRNNRFIGGDRVGDTSQLTLALSSRWLDANDTDRLQAHIGQIFYFKDRQVVLPSGSPETQSHSETVAELSGILSDHWYARSTWAIDPDSGSTSQTRQYLQYQPRNDRILGLGYRYVASDGESVDVSGQWKFNPRWTLFSRLQYRLGDGKNLDSYAGFRYQACCWAIQAMASRRVDSSGQQVSGMEFRLTLRGLGASGFSDARLPLSQSVFSDK